jgi:hypothetical protein
MNKDNNKLDYNVIKLKERLIEMNNMNKIYKNIEENKNNKKQIYFGLITKDNKPKKQNE